MSLSARYVAIIMDGNAEWAERHGLPIIEGHQAGMNNLKARLHDAVDLGIEQLTVFVARSRPELEVAEGVQALSETIAAETPELAELGVRLRFIGGRAGISAALVERMASAEAKTAASDRINLFCGLNYGGRTEIVDAAQAFESGGEGDFHAHLCAPAMQDPDVLIRTGGERRLSSFLLGSVPTPS